MSKSKKNTKETKANKTKSSSKKDNVFNESWKKVIGGTVLDSDFAEDVKEGVNKFIHSANDSLNAAMHSGTDNATYANKLMQNLSDNINSSVETNIHLSQECLKCRNAVDFIEIQKKFFEHNFKTSLRTFTDLVHDVQQLANHNIKNSSKAFK